MSQETKNKWNTSKKKKKKQEDMRIQVQNIKK